MIQCFVEHWFHAMTMTSVPNGQYDVYLTVWSDWDNPNAQPATFYVQGVQHEAVVLRTRGEWRRLGPWRAAVSDGSLVLTSSGDSVKVSGLEVWRAGG